MTTISRGGQSVNTVLGILGGEDEPRCSIGKSPKMFTGSILAICSGDSSEGPAEGMLGNKPFNA